MWLKTHLQEKNVIVKYLCKRNIKNAKETIKVRNWRKTYEKNM